MEGLTPVPWHGSGLGTQVYFATTIYLHSFKIMEVYFGAGLWKNMFLYNQVVVTLSGRGTRTSCSGVILDPAPKIYTTRPTDFEEFGRSVWSSKHRH